MNKQQQRANAINTFIATLKSEGLWDSVKASCIMAGWDNISGALTPLVGAAPTNVSGGFTNSDYDSGVGLKGDGTSYLDSEVANNSDFGGTVADPQNDKHVSLYVTTAATTDNPSGRAYIGAGGNDSGATNIVARQIAPLSMASRANNATASENGSNDATGFMGISRSVSPSFLARIEGVNYTNTETSQAPQSGNIYVYRLNWSAHTGLTCNVGLSFYSIGTAISDLAVLDSAVSTLMTTLRGIDEQGMDADALTYIRAVETADGGFLETPVKIAIDNLVKGLKADNLWDSIKASCLLCGPRTLNGALVPLVGGAPTNVNNNFVDADYNRETGLVGDGSTKRLTQQNLATPLQDSAHQSIFLTTHDPATIQTHIAEGPASGTNGLTQISLAGGGVFMRSREGTGSSIAGNPAGLLGSSRSSPANYVRRQAGINTTISAASTGVPSQTIVIFSTTGFSQVSSSRLAFYSIGESISDLALLDARVTALVTSIGAAL